MEALIITLLIIVAILLIWNLLYYLINRRREVQEKLYYELNARVNYITATGSVLIALLAYLGYNNEQNLRKEYQDKVSEFTKNKSWYVDSVIRSKDILRAGTYIVNDIVFKEDSIYKFEAFKTINNKGLPTFTYAPKLLITTTTGENLRVKSISTTSFSLSRPISKLVSVWSETDNKGYPKVVKFDLWIADFGSN